MKGSGGDLDHDSSAREVLRCYAVCCPQPVPELLGNHGGFSGARLWRIASPAGPFCLRAWPPGDPAPDRLHIIHESMILARRSGLAFVPAVLLTESGATFTERAGRLWELTTWMPGRADFHDVPTPARLEAACAALARLHHVWCQCARSVGSCTGVLRRVERARAWIRHIRQGWQPSFTPADPFLSWTPRAWDLLRQHVSHIPEQLATWVGEEFPLHRCLCDIWHDHVLFEKDAVTGLIDFGAVKQDHAAVDLARLLGSLVGDDTARWKEGIAAYRQVRPFSDKEEMLAHVLDRTGTILALGSWLRWLYLEGKSWPNREAVVRRLAELVHRVEGW